MPQGTNFSLIGGFGNCPLVARMIPAHNVIRGGGPRQDVASGGAVGTKKAVQQVLWLGARLDDLLLDERKVSGQGTGAQQHGHAVGLLEGEIA